MGLVLMYLLSLDEKLREAFSEIKCINLVIICVKNNYFLR